MRGARGHDGDEERYGDDEEPGVVGGSKGRVLKQRLSENAMCVFMGVSRVYAFGRDSLDCSWLLLLTLKVSPAQGCLHSATKVFYTDKQTTSSLTNLS